MRTDYRGEYINNIPDEFIDRFKLITDSDESFDLIKLIINLYKEIDRVSCNRHEYLTVWDKISDLEHDMMNLNFNNEYNIPIINKIAFVFKKLFDIEGESLAFQTIRRLGEWFLLDHESAKFLFDEVDISNIPVFNKDKSIYKNDNTDLSLIEIIKLNEREINTVSDIHKLSDIIELLPEVIDEVKKDKEFLRMADFIEDAYYNTNVNYLCWKDKSSSYGMNPGSQITDNFYYYNSDIVCPNTYKYIYGFEMIELNNNYDFCKIGIGLGPYKKIRYVYSAPNMIQNSFHFIRVGMSNYYKSFEDDEELFISSNGRKGSYCEVRTDNQYQIFNVMIRNNLFLDTILSFDISKYSDYLLVQLMDLVADIIIRDEGMREDFKKALRMPVKHKNKYYYALFGTLMGIKGNFDFITDGNKLIVKIAECLFKLIFNPDLELYGLQVVGDDIILSCSDDRFPEFLRFIYGVFNCKINKNKANIANSKNKGVMSFTKKYFRYNDNFGKPKKNVPIRTDNRKYIPISGIPINSFLKDIHSLNWFSSLKRNLKDSDVYSSTTINKMLKILLEQNKDKIFLEYISESEHTNYYKLISDKNKLERLRDKYQEEFEMLFSEFKMFPLELGGFNDYFTFESIINTESGRNKINNLIINNSIRYDIFRIMKNNKINMEKLINIFGIDHPVILRFFLEEDDIQKKMIKLEQFIRKLGDNNISNTIDDYKTAKKLLMDIINLEFRNIKEENSNYDLRSVINRTNKYYYEDKFIMSLKSSNIDYYPINDLSMRVILNSEINKDNLSMIFKLISINGGFRIRGIDNNNIIEEMLEIIMRKEGNIEFNRDTLYNDINIINDNFTNIKRQYEDKIKEILYKQINNKLRYKRNSEDNRNFELFKQFNVENKEFKELVNSINDFREKENNNIMSINDF
jgi:hypothetical protein